MLKIVARLICNFPDEASFTDAGAPRDLSGNKVGYNTLQKTLYVWTKNVNMLIHAPYTRIVVS